MTTTAKLSKILLFLANKKADFFIDNLSQYGTSQKMKLKRRKFQEARLAVLKREDGDSRIFRLAVDLKSGSRSWFFFLNPRSSSPDALNKGDFLQAAVPNDFSVWEADCSGFKKIFVDDFAAPEDWSWTFSWLEDCRETLKIDLDRLLDSLSKAVFDYLMFWTDQTVALTPWPFGVDVAEPESCWEKIELELDVCSPGFKHADRPPFESRRGQA